MSEGKWEKSIGYEYGTHATWMPIVYIKRSFDCISSRLQLGWFYTDAYIDEKKGAATEIGTLVHDVTSITRQKLSGFILRTSPAATCGKIFFSFFRFFFFKGNRLFSTRLN